MWGFHPAGFTLQLMLVVLNKLVGMLKPFKNADHSRPEAVPKVLTESRSAEGNSRDGTRDTAIAMQQPNHHWYHCCRFRLAECLSSSTRWS